MGDRIEDLILGPLGKADHATLMATGAKISSFTRKSQKGLLAALLAPYPGKALAQVPAVQILEDDLPYHRAPKTVFPLVPFGVELLEPLEVIFNHPVKWRELGLPGTLDSDETFNFRL